MGDVWEHLGYVNWLCPSTENLEGILVMFYWIPSRRGGHFGGDPFDVNWIPYLLIEDVWRGPS